MSVPTSRQAFTFLAPLKGKASIFVAPDRRGNMGISRFLLGCLAVSRTRAVIFDTSSFYGSNVRTLTESLPKDFFQRATVIEPEDDQEFDSLTKLLSFKTDAVLIDDLNALFYLFSSGRHKSGIQQLFAFLRLLSCEARINRTFAFATVYKSEGGPASEKPTKRSLLAAADLQILTECRPNRVTFRCDNVENWPNNRFGAPLYLEPRT